MNRESATIQAMVRPKGRHHFGGRREKDKDDGYDRLSGRN